MIRIRMAGLFAGGIVLVALLLGSARGADLQVEAIPSGPNVTVVGVLLNPNKSPATNVWVYVFESKEKGHFTLLMEPPQNGQAKLLNFATTDAKGHFTILVSRAFLETRQAVLCVNLRDNVRGIIPQYPNGKALVVRAPPGSTVVDLGKVVIVTE